MAVIGAGKVARLTAPDRGEMRAFVIAVGSAGLLAACAIGPSLGEKEAKLPPLPAGKARLFIYRPAQFWTSLAQPRLLLDGEHIGDAVPGGVLYVDVPPGERCIMMEPSPLYRDSGAPTRCVELRDGGTAYVRAMMVGRDLLHFQHYDEEWRWDDEMRRHDKDDRRRFRRLVRTYQSGFALGSCAGVTTMKCEERIITVHSNDLTVMDHGAGRAEALDLVLLEVLLESAAGR